MRIHAWPVSLGGSGRGSGKSELPAMSARYRAMTRDDARRRAQMRMRTLRARERCDAPERASKIAKNSF